MDLYFDPSIEFIIFKKKKPIGLIFSIFILIISITFAWSPLSK